LGTPISSLLAFVEILKSRDENDIIAKEAAKKWKDTDSVIHRIEKNLTDFFESQDVSSYTRNEVHGFYENLSMHKNTWRAFFSCQKLMAEIDFNVLKESRF